MVPFLVYVSSAAAPMDAAALRQLLVEAPHKNARLGVTGALLYQNSNFMQILEGDLDTIEDLFDTICADPRHHGVIRLIDGWNDSQQFDDWSMAFDDLSATTSVTTTSETTMSQTTASETKAALGVGLRGLLHAPGDDPSPALARMLMSSFRTTLHRDRQPTPAP